MWTKEEIGQIIKESRIAVGLTQKQVATSISRPQQTIASWESGKSQPDANTLFELFQVLGRSVDEAFGFTKQPFEVTRFEQEHIKKYRALDWHGKEMVDIVLDKETERMEAEQQAIEAAALQAQGEQPEVAEELIPEDIYSIPLYVLPMSAGTGQIAAQEYPEDFLLKKRPPRGTSFIARVSGNSMEPTYHDGDLVFVHATVDIRPGQTGAFLMDGQLWIKELGDGVLISHNPEYDPIPMRDDIRCQGLVLGVCDESYFE